MTMQPPVNDGNDLDARVDECRAYVAEHPGDDEALAALAGALHVRCHGLLRSRDEYPAVVDRARADWIEAVTLLGGVLSGWLDDDPYAPGLADEVGDYSDLLRLALRLGPLGPRDSDTYVTWASWLFDRVASGPPQALSVRDEMDLRVLLADELVQRSQSGVSERQAGLQAAIEHYEAALPLIPADDEEDTLADVLLRVTSACWQLLDDDAERHALIDRVVQHARQAWDLLDAEDENRDTVGTILATALNEQSVRSDGTGQMDLLIAVLEEVVPRRGDVARSHGATEGDARHYLEAKALLGIWLLHRAHMRGGQDDLDAAGRVLSQAASELATTTSRWPDIADNLALMLADHALMGMTEHLDQAIDLLRGAADRNPSGERGAQVRAGLGQALILQSAYRRTAGIAEGLKYLREGHDMAPLGSVTRILGAINLGSILTAEFFKTGDRQQLLAARLYQDAAERDYRDRNGGLGQQPSTWSDEVAHLEAVLAANRGNICAAEAMNGDSAKAEEAVSSFRRALDLLPAGHAYSVKWRCDLALVRMTIALSQDEAEPGRPELRATVIELDAAARVVPAGHQMYPVAWFRAGWALAALGLRARDPGDLRTGIAVLTDLQRDASTETEVTIRCVSLLGIYYAELYAMTADSTDLAAALAWQENAVAEFESAPGHPVHADMLVTLARLYRASGQTDDAIKAGLSALRTRVGDVLLQSGTAHGLAAARDSADNAAEIAGWCLEAGEPGWAVQALELGRGLVLYAATAVTTLPDLLEAVGLDDLAREWRDQPSDVDWAMPWEGDGGLGDFTALLAGAPLQSPSDLRRRTLDGLAGYGRDRLQAPPDSADIAAALRLTGADALVYLLPPQGSQAGRALIVPADGRVPQEVMLPLLTELAAELTEYQELVATLAAADDPGEELIARRHQALDALCDWAGPAVIEPVLEAVPGFRAGAVPRLVLVPLGQLSVVPWHAARVRPGSVGGAVSDPPADQRRYAVEIAVLSYAASGRQLIEVSQRPMLPLASSPVILADPTSTLDEAKLEARPLAERLYPGARYLGPDERADGPGTPTEVLAALPSAAGPGASLLHLACHAFAADAPDRSCFLLADEETLTVESILRRAAGRPAGAGGGLIDLMACHSDRAAARYDEALTLATALLAAGACTVVGARWDIRVEQSAVLAYMFHRFLVRDGLGPRDALRQTQLWMLDQHRPVPEDMPAVMARKARTGALALPMFWAAITHQGW